MTALLSLSLGVSALAVNPNAITHACVGPGTTDGHGLMVAALASANHSLACP